MTHIRELSVLLPKNCAKVGLVLEMRWMARKRYSDEDILLLLYKTELSLASGSEVAIAYRTAGVIDATYFTWSKQFGGIGRSEMANLKAPRFLQLFCAHLTMHLLPSGICLFIQANLSDRIQTQRPLPRQNLNLP